MFDTIEVPYRLVDVKGIEPPKPLRPLIYSQLVSPRTAHPFKTLVQGVRFELTFSSGS